MNYEKMWNELKAGIMAKVDDKTLDAEPHEAYLRTLIDMTRIEAREYAKSRKVGTEKVQKYTVKQDITGSVDIEALDMKKVAREMLERITGTRVIDNLNEVVSSPEKHPGFILVDMEEDIPHNLMEYASSKGIRIAQVGIDLVCCGSTKMPRTFRWC